MSEKPPSRSDREKTQLIGGHFPKPLGQELRILAANEGTTIKTLLGEAIGDLFKKRRETAGAPPSEPPGTKPQSD